MPLRYLDRKAGRGRPAACAVPGRKGQPLAVGPGLPEGAGKRRAGDAPRRTRTPKIRGVISRAFRCLWLGPLLLLLSSCIYVPRTTQVFDPQCRVMANHMVLEGEQVGAIQHCANEGCVALIVAAAAVTAATVIVSGTIVVIGNVAYWFERNARCQGATVGL